MVDSDQETQSNSTYLCGLLFQYGGNQSLPYYNRALTILSKLFSDKITFPNLLDNMCGCIARMILSSTSSIPLENV